jgi:SAM-dependent methyltransferase
MTEQHETSTTRETPPSRDVVWLCPSCRQPVNRPGPEDEKVCCTSCRESFYLLDGIWEAAPGFKSEGFGLDRCRHLAGIEEWHFWFKPRLRLLKSKLEAELGGRCGSAIELGCGSGRFLETLTGSARKVVAIEGHLESLFRARDEGTDALLIHGDVLHVPLEGSSFDLVVALDVLEHVEPLPLLREAFRLARPGGLLLLSVPALSFRR